MFKVFCTVEVFHVIPICWVWGFLDSLNAYTKRQESWSKYFKYCRRGHCLSLRWVEIEDSKKKSKRYEDTGRKTKNPMQLLLTALRFQTRSIPQPLTINMFHWLHGLWEPSIYWRIRQTLWGQTDGRKIPFMFIKNISLLESWDLVTPSAWDRWKLLPNIWELTCKLRPTYTTWQGQEEPNPARDYILSLGSYYKYSLA